MPIALLACVLLLACCPDRAEAPDGHATDRAPADSPRAAADLPAIKPGAPRQLTSHGADDQNPLWSPDGARLVFTSKRASGGFDLWIMNADGSGAKALTSLPDNDEVNLPGSAWCKATDRIVFSSDKGGPENIWTIKSDGTGLTQVSDTPYLDQEPTWSPTCDRIAFQSSRDGNWDIYVMKADGSNVKRLTTHAADDWAPNWSPTSDTILFQSMRTGTWKLWTVQASGGAEVQLTTGDSEDTDCSWSADGQQIVFSTDAGGSAGARIAILRLGQPAKVQLVTSGNRYDGAPCWSPLRRTIAFESDRSGNLDLWTVDLW
jgi:Tol biopolymer transport system component